MAFRKLLVVFCFLIPCIWANIPANVLNNLKLQSNSSNADYKIWALLAAGSDTYDNYRHQSDVCHSYHVLRDHGIPDEQIVVMMYDDIAFNILNPTPGVIINHPDGDDVYDGVPKDYVGEAVTPETFLKVLQGNSTGLKSIGSGKTIKSGPDDHIFVYFSDHGGPGILAFPDGVLRARNFNDVLKNMSKKKQFAKMVLYIEACHSGSMFAKGLLPENINVYATTAANPGESSYACYYDSERRAFLGDEYSVNWMEDSDSEVLTKESLSDQHDLVKEITADSHVMLYGDTSMGNLKVSEFQGSKQPTRTTRLPRKVPLDAVPSEDVPLVVVERQLQNATTSAEKSKLQRQLRKIIHGRNYLRSKVVEILSVATGGHNIFEHVLSARHPITDFDCYEQALDHFDQECFSLSKNPYALTMLYTLVNLCHERVSIDTIRQAMDEVCIHPNVQGIK